MSAIKPGDLCVVVRDCCGHWCGRIITAAGPFWTVKPSYGIRCDKCGHCSPNGTQITATPVFPVPWLKKIPPLAELEGADTREVAEA